MNNFLMYFYIIYQTDMNLMYIGLVLYEYIIQNIVSYT